MTTTDLTVEKLRVFIERHAPKYLRDDDGVAYEGAQHVEMLAALSTLENQIEELSKLTELFAIRIDDAEASVERWAKQAGLTASDLLKAEARAVRAEEALAELSEAIPIVTDGRFDADSAIEHLRRYKDDNW